MDTNEVHELLSNLDKKQQSQVLAFMKALPSIERMKNEGSVFILKWDGERGADDNGPQKLSEKAKAELKGV